MPVLEHESPQNYDAEAALWVAALEPFYRVGKAAVAQVVWSRQAMLAVVAGRWQRNDPASDIWIVNRLHDGGVRLDIRYSTRVGVNMGVAMLNGSVMTGLLSSGRPADVPKLCAHAQSYVAMTTFTAACSELMVSRNRHTVAAPDQIVPCAEDPSLARRSEHYLYILATRMFPEGEPWRVEG